MNIFHGNIGPTSCFSADVKRALKKREETVQLVISLLSPEGRDFIQLIIINVYNMHTIFYQF